MGFFDAIMDAFLRQYVSAHGEFGSIISYPLRHILLFFLHMHGIRLNASMAVVFFLAWHCIIALYI